MESISRSRGSGISCVGLLNGFVCDYLAHTQTSQHRNQNSDQPCLWCDTMWHFYSPLLNALIPTTWSQLFDSSNFKVVDSSMNQIHLSSLYRLSSMIGGIVTSHPNRMISDGIGEYFDSISIEQFKEPFNVTLCFCKLFLNETNLL